MRTISISSQADLPTAAAQVRAALAGHTVICFEGEMGAGKTTFIKALCRELGVSEEVSSPTFALVNEYRTAADVPIYHFDFYRLDEPAEAERIGASEYFDSGYLCLIEWPARVAPLLPDHCLTITLTVTGASSRQLKIEN